MEVVNVDESIHVSEGWLLLFYYYYYASVGGASRHTVVRSCIRLSVCLSVGRISRRSLYTKR